MTHLITTQPAIRKLFWEECPWLDKKRIKDYRGNGLLYTTDTRVAFGDFIDQLARSGDISEALAQRATL